MRRPANLGDGRTGSLLVNPGGPGVPGTTIPEAAELYLSEDLLDRFDIVGWDPEGPAPPATSTATTTWTPTSRSTRRRTRRRRSRR